MTYTLLADVGGTSTRLACMQDGKIPEPPAVYNNCNFSVFADVLADFLARQSALPAQLALAVAGPVHDHSVAMTNLGWTVSAESLEQQFGIPRVAVVNDFAALAWATLELEPCDLYQVGGGAPLENASRGVLGPGTGLGVSGLIASEKDWAVMAGEGGHVSVAATNAEEARLIAHVAAEFGHCSAERLLSGPGLARIYSLSGGTECAPEHITRMAKAGDRTALHAVELFSSMLGTVAGNLALTLGARGGIYLAGGILPAIRELLAASGFRKRFEAKGRFAGYLAAIPVYVITRPNPSFAGLDVYLRRNPDAAK